MRGALGRNAPHMRVGHMRVGWAALAGLAVLLHSSLFRCGVYFADGTLDSIAEAGAAPPIHKRSSAWDPHTLPFWIWRNVVMALQCDRKSKSLELFSHLELKYDPKTWRICLEQQHSGQNQLPTLCLESWPAAYFLLNANVDEVKLPEFLNGWKVAHSLEQIVQWKKKNSQVAKKETDINRELEFKWLMHYSFDGKLEFGCQCGEQYVSLSNNMIGCLAALKKGEEKKGFDSIFKGEEPQSDDYLTLKFDSMDGPDDSTLSSSQTLCGTDDCLTAEFDSMDGPAAFTPESDKRVVYNSSDKRWRMADSGHMKLDESIQNALNTLTNNCITKEKIEVKLDNDGGFYLMHREWLSSPDQAVTFAHFKKSMMTNIQTLLKENLFKQVQNVLQVTEECDSSYMRIRPNFNENKVTLVSLNNHIPHYEFFNIQLGNFVEGLKKRHSVSDFHNI
eukprot:GHVT01087423.1.p1 GENE.GHVT01087423.1~~GHVT01087423.1.p1  ORF type:complete len:448 (+),score=48.25 GHVT01087423.1:220-1563(+)